MSSLNKAILIGRLGKDPEVRYTQNGQSVANFSLATSENWTDQGGNKQERTEWHNIVAWGKLADLSQRFLAKGRQVYVEGRIQSSEYTDRDGVKRRKTDINATQIVFLGGRTEGGGDYNGGGSSYPDGNYGGAQQVRSQGPDYGSAPAPPPPPPMDQSFDSAGITDSDIPF